MSRTVTYSVSPRVNPQKKDEAPKFYAQVQANGDCTIREMAERIQASCTVTKADVYAVLVALEDVIIEALQNGEIVRLGDLGTFQIGISGKGAPTEEEHTSALIKKARINFRPGNVLSSILGSLNFSKVALKKAASAGNDEDNTDDTGGGTNTPGGGNSGTGGNTGGSDDTGGDDDNTNDDGGADFN